MARLIAIMGESGSGKATAMRTLDPSTTFYIDCTPSVCDPESGALSSSYSSDGVHLRTEYYYLWRDYLFTKGIDPENPH